MTNLFPFFYNITYSQFEKKWDEYGDIILQIHKNNTDEEIMNALKEQIKFQKKYPKYYKKLLKEIYKKV